MWFKNLRLYRFTQPFSLTHDQLADALAGHSFKPCGSLDPMRYGWVPPLGREGVEYVHSANGYMMICAKRQEKILPAAVVNEQLDERVAEISAAEARHVSRKERQELKDEVIFSLMPKAFTKSSLDFAYIAPREGLIVINAASAKRAEELLSALREALGSLGLIPVTPNHAPTQMMTHWLRSGELPAEFSLGEECELQGGKDGRVIRCKNQDLTADEIMGHLNSGMFVSRLALTWKEAIHCLVDDQLAVKRLKFEDSVQERASDRNPESKAEEFDADFAIMTLELSAFIEALLAAFGGEDQSLLDA
jgi:recombination associated protein RdgC